MTLEEMIEELECYGRPSMFQYDHSSEWLCKVDLNVRVTGGTFEIKSSGKSKTCYQAVEECLIRVRALLKDIHKLAPQVPHKKPGLEHRQ